MKRRLPYILFLFSALFTYGQVTLAVSEVKDAKVNQRFNLTVILEINGENMEQETPLRMPDLSKFDIIGSASEQNTIVLDGKKGEVLNQMVYQWVLSPKESGKVKFGSVLVTVNGKIYKTEPFEFNVRESEANAALSDNAAHRRSEVYLNLEFQNKVVYKNQPAVAVLRAYSKDYGNFRKVSNIQFRPQGNVRITPINLAKSEIETNAGMASQILGTYMIFPNESGTVEINPVSALVSNTSRPTKISSNKAKLSVKKLPAGMPLDFKNAVGQFDVSVAQSNSYETPEVEKPVTITMRLSGAGNLETLHLPQIVNSPNYISFTPQITFNTNLKKNGLSGNVIADYVIIPKKSGPVSINFENFSFFDPQREKYVDLGTKSLLLNVKTHDQIVDAKTTIEKVNDYTNVVLETVNTPILQTHNLKIKDKSSINWKIVVGNLGLMVAVLSLFLFIRKKTKKRSLALTTTPTNSSSIAETEAIIRQNLNHHFQESIDYLKKLVEAKDFKKFFAAYQELHTDVKKYYSVQNESEFRKYLERTHGANFVDEYRDFAEKIQIEKFAPFHTDEHIEALLQSIVTLYQEIIK